MKRSFLYGNTIIVFTVFSLLYSPNIGGMPVHFYYLQTHSTERLLMYRASTAAMSNGWDNPEYKYKTDLLLPDLLRQSVYFANAWECCLHFLFPHLP